MMYRMIAYVLIAAVSLMAKDYTIDKAHSSIGFGVKHLGISTVRGVFKEFTGSFSADETKEMITALRAEISTASIDTSIAMRDDKLRAAEYFNASEHPKALFIMRTYQGNKSGGKVIGDFTLRGVTKPLTLDLLISGSMIDNSGKTRVAGTATGSFNRSDFGVGKKDDMPIGTKVTLTIEIEAVEQ